MPHKIKTQAHPNSQTDFDGRAKHLVEQMLDMSIENKQMSALAKPVHPKLNRDNIVGEFARYFGSESKLENWQRLCSDVGIKDILTSIKQCKLALRRVWVNIYDLIAAVRQSKVPRCFRNEFDLRTYTINSRKIFPKKKAKEGGPVRALLAHIF
ncbi:hypothetical protein WAI453_013492 [Rhynchosporium graminicola]|uniref:Uncharacterized protein n=1 Tax=Rhynchosporium graminicola TaxID=2792576 RepID=A0A1E1KAC4_9HELO|nr:uncharacterized protein RCO7_06510 [Rhynchosporium commune]